jgi:hypothetical protein
MDNLLGRTISPEEYGKYFGLYDPFALALPFTSHLQNVPTA